MTATITVIMPAYNAERTIRQAIDSMLAQTFEDWELWVYDDGSTDQTADIVRTFTDPRIKLFESPRCGHGEGVRALAVPKVTTPMLTFLDADDTYQPNKLAVQFNYLHQHPECKAVSSGYYRAYEDAGRVERWLSKPGVITPRAFFHYKYQCYQQGLLYRREVFEVIPQSPVFATDLVHFLTMLLRFEGNIHYIAQPLWTYRIRSDSTVHHSSLASIMRLHQNARDNVIPAFRELAAGRPHLEADVDYFAYSVYRLNLTNLLAAGYLAEAKAILNEEILPGLALTPPQRRDLLSLCHPSDLRAKAWRTFKYLRSLLSRSPFTLLEWAALSRRYDWEAFIMPA